MALQESEWVDHVDRVVSRDARHRPLRATEELESGKRPLLMHGGLCYVVFGSGASEVMRLFDGLPGGRVGRLLERLKAEDGVAREAFVPEHVTVEFEPASPASTDRPWPFSVDHDHVWRIEDPVVLEYLFDDPVGTSWRFRDGGRSFRLRLRHVEDWYDPRERSRKIKTALAAAEQSSAASAIRSPSLGASARVDYEPAIESWVVHATFRNTGSEPLAFSETFGYGEYSWIGVRVRRVGGERIPFYTEEVDLFERPHYRCLRAGEAVEWSMRFSEWRIMVGGKEATVGTYRFAPPSGRYELQVLYSDQPKKGLRCPALSGVVQSNWIPFEVQAE